MSLLEKAKAAKPWRQGQNGKERTLDKYEREEVVALVRAYFDREITAADVARACGFSSQYVGPFLLSALNREIEEGGLTLDWRYQ